MSVKVMNLVFAAGPDDMAERFTLLTIADNADDSGFAFPGMPLIATKTCQSERNAIRIVNQLEVGGWIVVKRKSWGKGNKGNSYQINVAKLAASHDTVSPEKSHDKVSSLPVKRAAKKATSKDSHDNTSPEISDDKSSNSQVTENKSQVTNTSFSDDKSCIAILSNHQEPSTEPSGGIISATIAPPVSDFDTSATQLAAEMFRLLAIVTVPRTQILASEAIRLQAESLKIAPKQSMLLIKRQAEIAQQRGETVNAFWFEDSKWKGSSLPAAVGIYRDQPTVEPEPGESTPDGADTELGQRVWDGMRNAIKKAIGTVSFQTWVSPIRQLGILDGELFIELPNDSFSHVSDRYEFSNYLPHSVRELHILTRHERTA